MIKHNFGQIYLTPIMPADHVKMFAARNHPDIAKWCRQRSSLEWHSHQEWCANLHKRSDVKMFAIRHEAYDSNLVGVCGLTDIDLYNRRAEFSLYIVPEYHRKGHGKNALLTLIHHGFLELNLNIIWGETFEKNPAAEMFEGIGFGLEGIRKQFYYKNGKYIDAYLYSMDREFFNDRYISVGIKRRGGFDSAEISEKLCGAENLERRN